MAKTNPRTFISFDFDNNKNHKVLFSGQPKNNKVPFTFADWSSKEELPQSTWEVLISAKIAKCDIMIVLVGKSAATATGIKKEIDMANNHNVPFFGVYIDGADSSTTLPAGLARSRVFNWEWDKIDQAIEMASKEGKNR